MPLMQRMEDSSLRLIYDCRLPICEVPPLWRLTNTLIKVQNGALSHKDVKNEDRPGYVHENTEDGDKLSDEKQVFARKCTHFTIIDNNLSGFLAENAQITR